MRANPYFDQLLGRLSGVKRVGEGWKALCPAHEDRNPSLSIAVAEDGKILIHCFAGCDTPDVLSKLGLDTDALSEKHSLSGKSAPSAKTTPREEDGGGRTLYDYTDASGKLLYQVVRVPVAGPKRKRFYQRRPDGQGGWINNVNGVRRVLYRLPAVSKAVDSGEVIVIVEGEKDADRLASLDLCATTSPGGGNWPGNNYEESLRGASVVIIPDNDGPGLKHAQEVVRSLKGVAVDVSICELPRCPPKEDVSYWLDHGGTQKELVELLRSATPFEGARMTLAMKQDGILMSEVQRESIQWLWSDRIPQGKLTVLDGDPGLGKSTVTLDLAARVSSGRPMPFESDEREPAGVILLTLEDGLGDTVRPRLEAMGANLDRIWAITTLSSTDGPRAPQIPDDLPLIESWIIEMKATLVVFDPLMPYLPSKINSFRDQDIRRALFPLAELAERTGTAIVVVRHLNKGSSPNPLYRGGGSIGIIGAARSGLLVAKDPEDPETKILCQTKSNLSKEAISLAFRVEGNEAGATRIAWIGQSDATAQDLLNSESESRSIGPGARAREFLRIVLVDGPGPAAEIIKKASDSGIAENTLYRAAEKLDVRKWKEGFNPSRWFWELPEVSKASKLPKSTEDAHQADMGTFDDLGYLRAQDDQIPSRSSHTGQIGGDGT